MRLRRAGTALVVVAAALVPLAPAEADQTTIGYDLARSGWDDAEPALTPASVQAANFGQLWSKTLPRPAGQDADSYPNQIYAQPIAVDGYLIVATEENQVDALDPRTGAVLWTKYLGAPFTPHGCGDLVPHVGITSTPVYDPATKSVYVLAKTTDGGGPHLRLHSLDIATGAERAHWPVTISGKASNSNEVLDPKTSNQRPGLLLLDDTVYIATASHCDHGPYVGYVAGVNVKTRALQLWSDEDGSTSDGAGIWQAGGAPMSDGTGRIFVATGNGVSPAPGLGTSPPGTLAESVVRLAVNGNGTLSAKDYFSPANNQHLDDIDADLGSGSPAALPDSFGTEAHKHLLVIVGKDAVLRLLDRDDLGGTAQAPGGTDDVVSSLVLGAGVWGRPAVFDAVSDAGTEHLIYLLPSKSSLRAVQVEPNLDGIPTLSAVGATPDDFGYTSGSPVVTSTGTDPASALVWVVTVDDASGADGMLSAYPAIPPSDTAWSPVFQAQLGTMAKFVSPATDSGRVFVGTRDGRVLGFGAPTTSAVAAPPTTNYGLVAVGQHVSKDIEITAQASTSVESITTTGPFAAGTPSRALPASVHPGDTITVPVDFAPTAAASANGTVIVTVDGGSGPERYPFTLTGVGAADGIVATPAVLDFGEVTISGAHQLSFTIRNTGTSARTFQSVTAPATGPFAVTGLPAPGSTLAAQHSIPVTVTFQPAAAGHDGATINLVTDNGSASVTLTGSGRAGAPRLRIEPAVLDFANVRPGATRTQHFTVRNVGKSILTINKAAPPSAPFTVAHPVSEGQHLAPGEAISVAVRFVPTTGRPRHDGYEISADDGKHDLQVRANTAPWTGRVHAAGGCLTPRALHAGVALTVVRCADAARFTLVHRAIRIGSAASRWCVSVHDDATAQVRRCRAVSAQHWSWRSDNHLVNAAGARCLRGVRGSPVTVWRCRAGAPQQWNLSGLYARRGLVSVATAASDQVCLTAGPHHRAHVDACDPRPNQIATLHGNTIRFGGRCLTRVAHGVHLAVCSGQGAQVWVHRGDGTLRNTSTGRCLTDQHGRVAAGTPVVLAPCTGADRQVWRTP